MIKSGENNRYNPEWSNGYSFDDRSVRHEFISKVFSIVAVQIFVTIGIIGMFVFNDDLKVYVLQRIYLFWIALGATFICMLVLVCCENVRRTSPTNYIMLGIFTLCEAFLLGVITIFYKLELILYAMVITFLVVVGLTLFALQTQIDFTACGGIMIVLAIILLVMGIVMIFFPSRTLHIIYCCFGVGIFGIYLIYDVQLMVGGNHANSISPEDYIFAALSIYIDVVTLFMYILQLLSATTD
ncbi:protein lifeguard 3-like [Teleopsis dalmanni]|uniref:protein lifeguard 3-like n=1 Tax=Teleopsis dalmanni TaxID=139649 RepID=UPI0018CF22D0|nr:protein lifeguard 3-like [Teleopsis dalmanni]